MPDPADDGSGSTIVVYGAIAADAAVAVAKFVAAALTGSSSMLSEGIHSTVDTANTCLLLLGQRLGRRPPDRLHPFGHAREIYFWSLLVAIVIFGLGGGMSTYQGVVHLLHPEPLESPTVSYWVLGASAVFGVASFVLGAREFRRQMRPGESWWRTFRRSKDPTVYTVVFEDGAALLGLLLAFLGVFTGHHFHNLYCDGAASVAIGVMMAVVACFLAWESRGLLVGESADAKSVEQMRAVAEADPAVRRVDRSMTMQLGPRQVLLTLDVVFRSDLTADGLAAAIDRLEAAIRGQHPEVRQVFIEAQALKTPAATRPPAAAPTE